MKLTLFDTHSYDREFFERENKNFKYKIEYLDCRLNAETAWKAKGSDAVCAFVNDSLDEMTLHLLKKMHIETVALRCAGYDNVAVPVAKALGIRILRVPSYSPHSIAEHAVALLLNLSRKLPCADDRMRRGNYSLEGLLGNEIFGRTIGVIGTGTIGTAFTKIMLGFGCQVIAYDPAISPELKGTKNFKYESLDYVIHKSDILSLHLPLTDSTRHLINQEVFSKMKKGRLLINTSRGGLIESRSLIEALKQGILAGAGLDVYENEKFLFFKDHSGDILQDDIFARLLAFQNVIITPHQAFFTQEAMSQIAHETLSNLKGDPVNPLALV